MEHLYNVNTGALDHAESLRRDFLLVGEISKGSFWLDIVLGLLLTKSSLVSKLGLHSLA